MNYITINKNWFTCQNITCSNEVFVEHYNGVFQNFRCSKCRCVPFVKPGLIIPLCQFCGGTNGRNTIFAPNPYFVKCGNNTCFDICTMCYDAFNNV